MMSRSGTEILGVKVGNRSSEGISVFPLIFP